MRSSDAIGLALTRLRASWLESLFVAIGLSLGVAVIASTLSFYRLVDRSVSNDRMLSEVTARIAQDENPRSTAVRKLPQGARSGPGERLALVAEDIDGAKSAAPAAAFGYFGGQVSDRKDSQNVATVVMGDYFRAFGLKAAEGRLFGDDEGPASRVVVLGARIARTMSPASTSVGTTMKVFGLDYRVIGVLQQVPATADQDGDPFDDRIFIPLRSSLVYEKMRGVPEISFLISDKDKLVQSRDQLRTYFDAKYGTGAIEISSRLDDMQNDRDRVGGVLAVLMTFAIAALFVANTNMLNVMLARGAKRTKSAGISFALGQSRAGLFRMHVLESFLLGVTGCAVGFGVSWGLIALIKQLFDQGKANAQDLSLDPVSFAVSAVCGLALNLLLAVYPAWRAVRLKPADAMRIE